MADWPRGGAGTPDAGERSRRSSSAGTPATRVSTQAAVPAYASVANRERRRAVKAAASGRESRKRLPARQCAAALPLRTRPDGFGILGEWESEWEG